jgi:hypothetical protein
MPIDFWLHRMQSSHQWTTFLDGVVLEESCEGGWSFDALFIRAQYGLGGSGIDCYYGYTGGEILSLYQRSGAA